jgi:hypothetical protein
MGMQSNTIVPIATFKKLVRELIMTLPQHLA